MVSIEVLSMIGHKADLPELLNKGSLVCPQRLILKPVVKAHKNKGQRQKDLWLSVVEDSTRQSVRLLSAFCF